MALRFGVLGTGYWAQETHATMLAAHGDVDLVAIWGRDPAKTEAAAGRFGVAGYTELDRLLAEVDAVAIAVPPNVQAELAVRAAAAGRHLLLDKPLALSLDGAERVAGAVAAGGVASLVFFTLRFLPEVAAWVEEAGAVTGWQGGGGAWLGSVFSEPDSPFADSAWRRAKGALWDLGPHVLSLTLPVLGPVERVTAATGPGDTVHLVLGHHSGASSTLTLSQTVPPPATWIGFDVYGPAGRSATPPFELAHLVAMDEAIGQLAAMVASGATTHPCDVRLGRDTVAVLDAAERFLSTGLDARTASVVS
ncbi:MAG TPA: Gfo/Idh/MocA family oxidoreductase [Actinomycetes bacterium]|nr:Gfo/Idh/MocA family oxidoreductase [Actinomycetes bacterium]